MIISEHEDFHNIIPHSLDALSTPFAVVDVDTYDIKIANKAFGGGESTGKKCYAVSHHREAPCNGDDHPCPIGEIRRTKGPAVVYHTHFDKKGNPRYLELHASPVFDKQNRLKYIIEQGIDITGHKITEDLLKKSEEKYRLLAEGTDAILWEYDILSDKWTYVAPQVEQILGYKPEEWTDYQFWLDRIHPDDQTGIDTYCKECTSRGDSHKFEYRFLAKNGSYMWVRDVVNVEMDHDQPIKLRGALVDITDNKELEKLKEDVDRITRHDIKTPLNGIIGIPQVLMDEPNITDTQREYLQMIIDSGRTVLNMISLSLTIYQIEQGTYEYSREYFDLLKVIRQCMGDCQSAASYKNSKIIISVNGFDEDEPETIPVAGEELLAYSVISNLGKNAVEASPKHEVVTIDITDDDSSILVSFHNKGAVPEKIRDTFFDKYTTYGKKDGTGIGTYSAKILSQAQGWSIGMQTSEEDGTKVTVTIPKTEEQL